MGIFIGSNGKFQRNTDGKIKVCCDGAKQPCSGYSCFSFGQKISSVSVVFSSIVWDFSNCFDDHYKLTGISLPGAVSLSPGYLLPQNGPDLVPGDPNYGCCWGVDRYGANPIGTWSRDYVPFCGSTVYRTDTGYIVIYVTLSPRTISFTFAGWFMSYGNIQNGWQAIWESLSFDTMVDSPIGTWDIASHPDISISLPLVSGYISLVVA
jgi:hypothetical protein